MSDFQQASNLSFTEQETKRLQVLRELDILDTPPESVYDSLTSLAARLFDVPVVLVSLLDEQRQWFKSCYGQEHLGVQDTARDVAFCSYTIETDELLVVPDATQDARFASNPLVTGPIGLRFYAGAPLHTSEGWRVASLCLMDFKPRTFSEHERALLRDLAAIASQNLQQRESAVAARHSENRFRSLLASTSDIIALLNEQGVIQYANNALKTILGYEPAALIGKQAFDLIHPEDRPRMAQAMSEVTEARREPHLQTFRFAHQDGSWRVMEVIGRLSQSKSGQELVVSARDITEREQTEIALRESEARKAAILESALDCLISIDHQGKVIEWNPSAERTFGYSHAQAVGCYLHELIVPPELRAAHIAGLQKYLETGQGPVLDQRLELPAVHADGTRILVEAALIAIPGFDPPIFTGHLRDITAKKANEEALRESEARYTRIAANVPGIVYQFRMAADGTMSFPFVSEGSRDVVGLEPQKIKQNAETLIRLAPAEDQESFVLSVNESAKTLAPWRWEGRAVLHSGEEKWLQGISRPEREENGDIVWDGLLLDITQRKNFETELHKARDEAEKARAEAERANHAKSEFLSRMSHELRTPLNAILGFGQLLELSELSQGDSQSIAHILKGGRHLLELINEVLDIAKIESGVLDLSPEPVSILEVCEEVLMLIRPLADKRDITLRNHTAQCSYFAQADRQRLKQILINLLSNAVKYNREGGHITIACNLADNDRVRLSVTDTGQGIKPEQRAKLFVPFERLGAETSGIEGTGIGLALSRHLAQAMEGLLDVDSTPGQGSTFYVDLPRTHSPLQNYEADAPAFAEKAAPTGQKTVLYIEDNLSNLQLLQRLMERRPSIELLSAMQGRRGLELAQTHLPDLILLDLHLPEMGGMEVLQELQANDSTSAIPVIIISADATPGQIERLLTAGARHYLTKPLDIHAFLKIIDSFLINSAAL